MIKLLTARNNIKKELRVAELNIEKALESKGYEVKALIDYNLTINNDGLNEEVKVKIFDFQNGGEDDEIITQVELKVDVIDLAPPSSLIDDIINLVEKKRVE